MDVKYSSLCITSKYSTYTQSLSLSHTHPPPRALQHVCCSQSEQAVRGQQAHVRHGGPGGGTLAMPPQARRGLWACRHSGTVLSAALCRGRSALCVAGLQISTCTCTDAPATAKAVSLCEQVRRGEQAHMRNGAGPARREPTSASSTAPQAT